MKQDYKRQHLRAPLGTTVLFAFGKEVFRARADNLSEGGMLVSLLPRVPTGVVHGYIDLPQFPVFHQYPMSSLKKMHKGSFERKVFSISFEIVRKDGTSEVDQLMQAKTGVRFKDISNESQINVQVYVTNFAKNIIHLIKLLEGSLGIQKPEDIRHVATLLGYDNEMKISFLRQKALHDYQSLQWL